MKSGILNPSHQAYAAHFLVSLCLMVWLSLPAWAWAHSNEYLATLQGSHGGMLRMAEMYHFELLVKNGEARIWVTDHGNIPQSTRGATGTLRFITGNGTFLVPLVPAGTHELLTQDSRIRAVKGTKIVLTVIMKGEQPLSARFSLNEK